MSSVGVVGLADAGKKKKNAVMTRVEEYRIAVLRLFTRLGSNHHGTSTAAQTYQQSSRSHMAKGYSSCRVRILARDPVRNYSKRYSTVNGTEVASLL
jgi:hypothetical protein